MSMQFHRYDGWPHSSSPGQAPPLTDAEARAYVAGFVLADERRFTGLGAKYVIRQYRNLVTGESRYIGGVFAGW